MGKIRTHEIFKIDINRFCTFENGTVEIFPLMLSKEEALLNGELTRVQENQAILAICNFLKDTNQTIDMTQIMINVHVPAVLKTKGEKMYLQVAKNGFDCNGMHYNRFASGSGQIRRNTITFLRSDLVEPITKKLLCGLDFSDFGNDFNSAKYNAYFGLNLSGCRLLPDSLTPSVCVVDDFEEIRPHDVVNYVTEREVNYITLPEQDYILSENDKDYIVSDGKAARQADGTVFNIRHGIKKDITAMHYDEIENSPCLNSFDGQGLMCPDWAKRIADYLDFGYVPSELIIRAPWVKGLLATIDFHKWFAEHEITAITDSFGKVRNVSDIDVIISKSQFKMHKVYAKKCQTVNAWDYHVQHMKENNLYWGIVKPNKHDDDEKTLNYQYLEALDIEESDIDRLSRRTKAFLESLNSGDIKEVYKYLVKDNVYEVDEPEQDDKRRRFQKAIDTNPELINDKYIRTLILRECQNKLDSAKLGKIIVRGNYQFCVSDPIAQLEHIARNHCGTDISVVGVVPSGCVYSNYWNNADDNNGTITLLRSPLIDRNEIANRKLIEEKQDYFEYLQSGIIYSIHDLTALQEGGCDFDGDIIFTTNDSVIRKGSYEYGVAKPLYYELTATGLVGEINLDNVSQADVRGLNSKVGQISNRAACLYAMLKEHRKNSKAYRQIMNEIIALGQIVGMEIDRIKTGVKPSNPLEWQRLQIEWRKGEITEPDYMVTSEDEAQGIYRHNAFVPDIKPYFLRYNYIYLDTDINRLRYVANQNCVINFGMKLDEIEKLCDSGNATEEMQEMIEVYKKAYPVNDSDCVVNHISHIFEKLQFDLQKKIADEGQNVIKQFVKDGEIDDTIKSQVDHVYKSYKRFMRIQTKKNKTSNTSSKEITNSAVNAIDAIQTHCQRELKSICGTKQKMFDALALVTKYDIKAIWDLMGDSFLNIVGGMKK